MAACSSWRRWPQPATVTRGELGNCSVGQHARRLSGLVMAETITICSSGRRVGIHATAVELDTGELSEGLRIADDVDIAKIGSLERKTAHLYQVARTYECKGNDTAVFVHLKMAERVCPEDFLRKSMVRNMVATLVKRAKPSYASDVREFAEHIRLLD